MLSVTILEHYGDEKRAGRTQSYLQPISGHFPRDWPLILRCTLTKSRLSRRVRAYWSEGLSRRESTACMKSRVSWRRWNLTESSRAIEGNEQKVEGRMRWGVNC